MKRFVSFLMVICLLFSMTLPAMAAEVATPEMLLDSAPTLGESALSSRSPIMPMSGMEIEYYARMRVFAKGTDGTPIAGAVYGLYQMDGTPVLEVTTDQSGVVLSGEFPIGLRYYLEGISVPDGWEPFLERIDVNPPDIYAPVTMEFTITHSRASQPTPDKLGQIQLVKKDAENGKLLSGAVFSVFSVADDTEVCKLTTGEDGTATTADLLVGDYYLVEQTAPAGYEKSADKYPVSVEESIVTPVTVGNKALPPAPQYGKIQLVKKDADNGKLLSGALFSVFSTADDTEVCKLTTGEDGTATTADLLVGDYYLVEQTAPAGYEKSTEKHPVAVTASTITEVVVLNKAVPPIPDPKPTTGTVKVLKVDAEDSKPLQNAMFSVYDKGGKKVGELLTGKDGTATLTLAEGDYTLRETTAPDGYQPASDNISFTLAAGATHTLTVKNTRQKPVIPEPPAKPGTLKIIKMDSDSGKKLEGAVFGVYNADTDKQIDTLTTNKNGDASISLSAGDYYIREQEAPKGYTLKKTDINFHLESGATRELTVKNAREDEPEKMGILEITKEDSDTGKALRNATFAVYTKDNDKVDEIITGRDGIAVLKLPVGSYYLREVEQPKGYILDRKKVDFKITVDKTTRVIMENEREKTDSEGTDSEESDPSGTLRIVKSAAGSGKRLSGAVFGVYEKTGDKKLFEVTTDDNGVATLDLPVGSYSLKELRAPSGYRVETTRILFDIRNGVKTAVEVTNERDGAPTDPENPSTPSTAKPNPPTGVMAPNPDAPTISIPQTGEPFPTLYYALAALLLGVAAVCAAGAIRQRKPENQ